MAYTTDISYDDAQPDDPLRSFSPVRSWSQQRMYPLLFAIGTIIAVIGWGAEWVHLAYVIPFFRYDVFIAIAGHALQVVGAFGMLLTPDSVEEDGE